MNKGPSRCNTHADRERPSGPNYRRFAIRFGCAVFAIACALVFILKGRQQPTIPGGFELVSGDFCFVRWSRDSSMQDVDPNSVFAVVNGVQRARFTLGLGERCIVESVGVTDGLGRPWLNLDFLNGQNLINHYSAEHKAANADPDVTYIDWDGDFLPDQRKDWASGDVSCLDGVQKWHPCSPPTSGSENGQ